MYLHRTTSYWFQSCLAVLPSHYVVSGAERPLPISQPLPSSPILRLHPLLHSQLSPGWPDAGRGWHKAQRPPAASRKPPPPASYRGVSASQPTLEMRSYRKKKIFSTPNYGPLVGSEIYVFTLVFYPRSCGENWLAPSRPRRLGSPPHAPPGPRPLARPSAWLSVSSLSLSIPFASLQLPRRLRPFPLPPLGAPNLPRPLPRRQADTRQIGIRERKGGKATRQPGNKEAIKAAPKWRAKNPSGENLKTS